LPLGAHGTFPEEEKRRKGECKNGDGPSVILSLSLRLVSSGGEGKRKKRYIP